MNCNHPPEGVLCGPLYEFGELVPFDLRPQNIREQDEERPQWCTTCGAIRWYRDQQWGQPNYGRPRTAIEVDP